MIKVSSVETIKDTQNNKYDFDRYNLEIKTGLSTKEVSVQVSFIENEDEIITGDIIAFGSWYDLELDECIEYLKIVKEQNKMKRDFSKFI
ncbi:MULTISPECIES: hypothetical protein [Lactococcus]|uniref:hypothetical protein n=1 Tax=Lactococcus TaxID=1357 RepID=UPI000583AF84|nr:MULTISPECIES: hypothetical protein [Lactococcus]KGH33023.1 hypothetical protein JL36_10045 [Lactococcus cremoris]KST98372.1 hypothetical protein KF196_1794 [Lactococcus lactis subsp. lactis]MCT0441933.1 hypothetical protein [Lactococcus lactis subsp. lactis]MDT2858246.1 hypothetical protein [Lactococcus lactis]MDT2874138.1 hypothetical protein [Lactococcus lactis]